MKIEEIIVVEGRDDTAAVKRSVDAVTIETHGFGIRPDTWDVIARAYREKGIIIFTDPDHAGEQIRRRILDRFPEAREAFLDRKLAEKDGDIGIENASPESIRQALGRARCTEAVSPGEFTPGDMFAWGLTGSEAASARRAKLGKRLGIGFANSRIFLQRINRFGVTREELEKALEEL